MKKLFLSFIAFLLLSASTFTNQPFATENLNISLKGVKDSIAFWQPMRALKVINELKGIDRKSPFYHYFKAKINFYLGNYTDAKKHFDKFTAKEKGWQGISDIAKLKTLIDSTIKATSGFLEEKRGHFIVRYKDGKDAILLDAAFEALEASYQKIGEALRYYPKEKILVEIYPSVDTFIAASGIPKKAVETSGTCALCSYNRIFITSPRSTLRGYRWLDTICHEYVHYVVYKIAGPRTPLWLHEGLANYMEKRWRSDGERIIDPGAENILAKRLEEGTLITFEQMTPSFAFLKTSQDVRLAFAQVMTIVEYLDKKKGMPSIRAFLDMLVEGVSVQNSLKKIFSIDYDILLKSWKEYLKEKGLKRWPALARDEVVFKDPDEETDPKESEENDVKKIASKEVRNMVMIGDMLRNRNRIIAASIEYTKAKNAAEGMSPVLENKLALVYYVLGNKGLAEKILLETEKVYPDFVTSYANLGNIYLSEERMSDAVKQLEEARDINPFNPWVYQNLIKVYKKTGQKDKGDYTMKVLTTLGGY